MEHFVSTYMEVTYERKGTLYDFSVFLMLKLSLSIKWKTWIALRHCCLVVLSCCSLEACLDWQFFLTLCLENTFTSKHPEVLEGRGNGRWWEKEKKKVWTESRLKIFIKSTSDSVPSVRQLLLLLNSREVFILTIWQLIMVNNAISSLVFLALGLAVSFFTGLRLSSPRAQPATNSCQGMVLLQVTLPESGPERTLNSPRWHCKDPQGQEGTGVQKKWASAWQSH